MTPLELPTPGRSAAPQVAYGCGAIHQVPPLVADIGARRVLLVSGRRSFDASGASAMLPELERVAAVRRWSDFRPNTDSRDLREGLQIMRAEVPDLVLAVGGGSALDMAKLLVAYAGIAPDETVATVEAGTPATARSSHLLLVPTTSGSGAEATHFAVVYVGEDKHSIAGPAMRADAIVLDPTLTLSGSSYQRATSGIDAVAQAIESLWAVGATERSRRFARHALRLLLPAIVPFVNEGDPRAARAMSIGSHLAGRAIDISKTTAAHALSYGLTKQHGVSHGEAVALTLGAFIEVHGQAPDDHLQDAVDPRVHRAQMEVVHRFLGATDPPGARRRLDELLAAVGLSSRLSHVGADTEPARRQLADSVNVERLGNNPIVMEREDLLRLLANCV